MSLDSIDYGSPAFFADPYPTYRRLLESGEPYYSEANQTWFVARYEDVETVLKEARISKRITRPVLTPLERSMLFQDPPDHTRLRALVSQAFTPKRIKDLEQRILEIADELIDGVESRGRMDFMAEFAMPLPITVIAEILGVPMEDRSLLHQLTAHLVTATDSDRTPEENGRMQMEAIEGLTAYFAELISKRRADLQEDILSALIQVHGAPGRLTSDELIGTAMLMLIAGHETTVNLFGNGLLTLLKRPEDLDTLTRRPELMPSAIEEMLRYESPVQQGTFRIVAEPVEIGGKTLEPGSLVIALLGAANRDPELFPDPDRFDITRSPNRHLGFGIGIHFCMGASLARAEARIGFSRLLERLPGLQLALTPLQADASAKAPHPLLGSLRRLIGRPVPPPPPPAVPAISWQSNAIVRSLKTLPVRW